MNAKKWRKPKNFLDEREELRIDLLKEHKRQEALERMNHALHMRAIKEKMLAHANRQQEEDMRKLQARDVQP